jgi:hypothetical protein
MLVAVALGGALMLGNSAPAPAGQQHAESFIYGNLFCSNYAPENGVAECTASGGPLWNKSHEQYGNNYIYGNAGTGHAHHHGSWSPGRKREPIGTQVARLAPILGSPGTSEYLFQTWVPNANRTKMIVTWSPKSFLQVDPSQLSAAQRSVSSRASIAANGGLRGSVELSAALDARKQPQTRTRLTGAFKGLPFDLVKHPGGVVSLQFRGPVRWTVRAVPASFDIALDGAVDSTPLKRKAK